MKDIDEIGSNNRIKSQISVTPVDWAQILNYLKASQFRVGLLFNFGSAQTLEKKRVII